MIPNDLINARELTTFAPLADEMVYNPQKNYLFDLSYLSGIHVAGEHAEAFLQGQVSCDVGEVNHNQFRQGALCNLKGRILALVDVLNWNGHGFQLILPHDLLLKTQESLTKTAMFSRVTLNLASNYQIFGLFIQNQDDILPLELKPSNTTYAVAHQESYCCYDLGNNFYVLLIENQSSRTVCDPFINKSQWRGSLAWHALQLQQKRIEIYPESRGLFLPHRVDLQLSGYLSFNKGCYKGQEIIARTHYRAKLKHALKIFTIHTSEPLQSGQTLFSDDGKVNFGELIDFCPIDVGKFLIAASMVFEHPHTVHIEGHQTMVTLEGV